MVTAALSDADRSDDAWTEEIGPGGVVARGLNGAAITMPAADEHAGPCVACAAQTIRYGPAGRPLCRRCTPTH